MPNIDAPMGLRAVRGEYNAAPRLETFTVKAATIIYEGAPVVLNTTGVIDNYTDAFALTANIIGVASHYVASAATDRELQVYSDPLQVYEIQADDNTITNAAGYLGGLFDLVNPTAGNTTTLQSTCELDGSSAATTVGTDAATLRPLRIEGISKNIENVIGGTTAASWTKFLVRFAPPVHHRGMGRVGVTMNTTFTGI